MSDKKTTHYRYERGYSIFDENTKYTCKIELIEFYTTKETDCGYWIKEVLNTWKSERFVLKQSNKRYAYPTTKEAFNSFKIRTNKSLGYARGNVHNAKVFLELIKEKENNG